jgi:hypothetical protein
MRSSFTTVLVFFSHPALLRRSDHRPAGQGRGGGGGGDDEMLHQSGGVQRPISSVFSLSFGQGGRVTGRSKAPPADQRWTALGARHRRFGLTTRRQGWLAGSLTQPEPRCVCSTERCNCLPLFAVSKNRTCSRTSLSNQKPFFVFWPGSTSTNKRTNVHRAYW